MRCVPARDFTVGKTVAWKSAINDAPPYQRESSIWSTEKQQLFIDSLLNGYDVPKIYLHDLRGQHPTKVYAVVDGRQRIGTMWRFLANDLPLADDFRIEPANLPPDLPAGVVHPRAGDRFRDLDKAWQLTLKRTYLAVVLIQNATEHDIEDLFSRLNNGEPLNAAEKRNAMGGDTVKLIREVVGRPFFKERVHFPNTRSQHMDLAARLVAIARADHDGDDTVPDLRGRAMDAMVKEQRRVDPAVTEALRAHVDAMLADLSTVFEPADPQLGTPGAAVIAALFLRGLRREGALPAGPVAADAGARVRAFLASFDVSRKAALERLDADPVLLEYTHLMQHGTNERRNLARRVEILVGLFGATAATAATAAAAATDDRREAIRAGAMTGAAAGVGGSSVAPGARTSRA